MKLNSYRNVFNIKLILIFFFVSVSFCFSQGAEDVKLTQGHNSNLEIIIDNQNRIHTTWNEGFKIWYGVFDSTGKNIKRFMFPHNYENFQQSNLGLSNSNLVVAWISPSQSFNSYVVGQILSSDADSANDGYLFFNGNYVDAYRGTPQVCFLTDTTFVVAWCGDGAQTDDGIYGQIGTVSGRKVGDVIFFGDHGTFFEGVKYAALKIISYPNNSDFVVFWKDNHTGKQQVYGRIFHEDGTAKDSSFLISDGVVADDIWTLSSCMDSSGNFGVAWGTQIDSSLLDSTWQIKMRWFQNDALPLGPIQTVESNSVTGFPELDIAVDKEGKGVIVWESGHYPVPTKIYARRFSSDKNIYGSSFKVSNSNDSTREIYPAVDIEEDNICVIWNSWNSEKSIQCRLIDFYSPPTAAEGYKNNNIGSFLLFQNFPNPFNPSTNIKFQIKNEGFVTLKIYDLLGREVKILINKELNPGTYNIKWKGDDKNGEEVSTGIYLYRLLVNSYAATKKMLLIR